jgi:hypothetical protein
LSGGRPRIRDERGSVRSRNDDEVDVMEARMVLGVGPDAVWPDVRASYLRLVREHHPDTAADSADAGRRTIRTAQITAAYSVLLANRAPTSAAPPTWRSWRGSMRPGCAGHARGVWTFAWR